MWPWLDTFDSETVNSAALLLYDGRTDSSVGFRESVKGDSIPEVNNSRVSYFSDHDDPKSQDANPGGNGGQANGDRFDDASMIAPNR